MGTDLQQQKKHNWGDDDGHPQDRSDEHTEGTFANISRSPKELHEDIAWKSAPPGVVICRVCHLQCAVEQCYTAGQQYQMHQRICVNDQQ
jgi:hypothetical protein